MIFLFLLFLVCGIAEPKKIYRFRITYYKENFKKFSKYLNNNFEFVGSYYCTRKYFAKIFFNRQNKIRSEYFENENVLDLRFRTSTSGTCTLYDDYCVFTVPTCYLFLVLRNIRRDLYVAIRSEVTYYRTSNIYHIFLLDVLRCKRF